MKTHWRKLVNPDFLGVYSLDDMPDMTLTIKEVKQEKVTVTGGDKKECTVLYFEENVKPMILNRTNSKTIARIYNTPFIQDWPGKKITVYPSTTKLAGEIVECLRIKNISPGITLEHKREAVISYAKDKILEGILNHYKVDDISKLSSKQIEDIYIKKKLR